MTSRQKNILSALDFFITIGCVALTVYLPAHMSVLKWTALAVYGGIFALSVYLNRGMQKAVLILSALARLAAAGFLATSLIGYPIFGMSENLLQTLTFVFLLVAYLAPEVKK